VLYAEDFHSGFERSFAFGKASGFSYEVRKAFSEFAAEAVDLRDADLIFWYVAKDYFADDAHNFLSFSDFLSYSVIYVSLWEIVFYSSDILFVSIAENGESTFPSWEAQSLGKQ